MEIHFSGEGQTCPLCKTPHAIVPALAYISENRQKLYYVFCTNCRSYFTVRMTAYLRLVRNPTGARG